MAQNGGWEFILEVLDRFYCYDYIITFYCVAIIKNLLLNTEIMIKIYYSKAVEVILKALRDHVKNSKVVSIIFEVLYSLTDIVSEVIVNLK